MPPKKKVVLKKVKKEAVVKKEVAVKKEVTVKKEQSVKVKKEISDDKKTGIKVEKKGSKQPSTGEWAKGHYKFQVGFLNEIVPPPWKVCFGALGTGIIGIRPSASSSKASSSSDAAPVVKQEVKEAPQEEADDADGLQDVQVLKWQLPSDATVVLLLNGPSCAMQGRNGTAMGAYSDSLDVGNRTLLWSSQRSDTRNHKISAIIRHCQTGGRVVVGIRDNIQSASFKLLGHVDRIDALQRCQFLVEDGEFLICEYGSESGKLHKCITAACLDAGLKAGTALTTKRHPLPENVASNYSFCTACCYTTPNAKLHFKELNEAGIAAYRPFAARKRGFMPVLKRPASAGAEGPSRRLCFKQEIPDGSSGVKKELVEAPVKVKKEPVEELSQFKEEPVVPDLPSPFDDMDASQMTLEPSQAPAASSAMEEQAAKEINASKAKILVGEVDMPVAATGAPAESLDCDIVDVVDADDAPQTGAIELD